MSIVRLNQVYNLTAASMLPLNMQFQIVKRTPQGNNSNYVVIKMHYPLPNMIQIKVNGALIDPILLTDTGLKRNLNTSVCGDNAYFYTNYTTHFVVTEDFSCLVEVLLTDSIQLTTHFAMSVNDFFNNNVLSSFIANLCALLGVTDTSRVKVVGVAPGSVVVNSVILPGGSINNATGGANATNATGGATLAQIQTTLNTQNQAISSGLASSLNTTMISMSATLHTLDSSSENKSSNIGIIVGVTVAGVILFVVGLFTFFQCLRKRAKIVEEIRESEEEVQHDKNN